MAIKILINLGLVLTPFFIWPGYDTRQPKMAVALVIALALGLLVIYQGKLKSFKNKWVLFFLAFILISSHFAPKPEILLLGLNVGLFWAWKAMFIVFVFALMGFTISSIDFAKKDKEIIFNVMVWCGFIMSLYVLSQWRGFDQWFVESAEAANWNTPNKDHLGGTLGNPMVASPFIAMIIPIALYLKKYWKAFVMVLAVYICHSQVAIGALIIAMLFLMATKSKRLCIVSVLIFFMIVSILGVGYFINPKVKETIRDNNRFLVWGQIVEDIKNPIMEKTEFRYPFTGFGMGSFHYVFPIMHRDSPQLYIFKEAHNDYMELLFNTGLIGLILFLCAIGYMVKDNFSIGGDREKRYLLSSFVCIAICAGGLFVFQLGAHAFYVIVIVGLLHNKSKEERV